jgi:hypothetical protein
MILGKNLVLKWFEESVISQILDSQLAFHSEETFALFKYIISQDSMGVQHIPALHKVVLHDLKAGV